MKRNFLASLLALCAIAGQAQGTQNSNSVSPDSVIIEGVVTNMPDGTRFMVLQEGVQGMQETIVKDGKFRNRSLSDYIIPTFEDAPPFETAFIDNPFIYGANGAKGMGELTLVGGAPAVALAIENAIGHKITKIPATPEYLMEVLNHDKD